MRTNTQPSTIQSSQAERPGCPSQGVTPEREELRKCPDGNAHRPLQDPLSAFQPRGEGRRWTGRSGLQGQGGTGHSSHGPNLPGFPYAPPPPTPLPEAVAGPGLEIYFLRLGQKQSQRIILEENCPLPAHVRFGQGSQVYLLTSLLPLPALIASWRMDIISKPSSFGKDEGRMESGPKVAWAARKERTGQAS